MTNRVNAPNLAHRFPLVYKADLKGGPLDTTEDLGGGPVIKISKTKNQHENETAL